MKLSIITINRNNAQGLRRTIESVVSQISTDFEYIIIDGASTDESVTVIREFENLKIWEFEDAKTKEISKRLQWLSEPDKGIYNAMNKGIARAEGVYLLFLNSGDALVDAAVVGDFYESNLDADVVTGNIYIDDELNRFLHISPLSDELSFLVFLGGSLPHPASFIRRNLFDVYGLYNENYKIVSDMEFFFKVLVVNNASYLHFDRVIASFLRGGISAQPEWVDIHFSERQSVYQSFMPPRMYNAILKLMKDNAVLHTRENEYHEYMRLKHGKFSLFIKAMLWMKSNLKSKKIDIDNKN